MNDSEQELCVWSISIRVYGTFTLLPLQDPTTQGTDTFEHRMTSFFESLYNPILLSERKNNFHTTSLPTLDPKMPNLVARIHRVILAILGTRNTILIIPIDVIEHWHEDDPVLELFEFDVLSRQIFWVSWRIDNDENPVKFVHSNSIASP